MHDVVQRNTFVCFVFLRTQTKVWGAVLQLGSARPLVLSGCFSVTSSWRLAWRSHFELSFPAQRTKITEWGGGSLGGVMNTETQTELEKKKKTWSFLFSYFDLLIWRPYLLCGSVHKPSPLVATHWARPLSFPSTTLIISPSLPPSLLAINFVQAWKIHHVGGLIRAGVFCQSSSCVWTFWTFNSLSF